MRFVVYGAGVNQSPIIAACQRRGWSVLAIDRDSEAQGAALADRFVCTSLREHDKITAALKDENILGVAARVTDPVALDSARLLSVNRSLPTACSGLLHASTSKIALAEESLAAGLRTPRRYAQDELIDFDSNSVIIRPDVTVRGKAGIYRVDTASELDRIRPITAEESENGKVDLSEWIEGFDVSVLAHLDGGSARRICLWDEWVALDPSGQIRGMGAGFPSVFEGRYAEVDATLDRLARHFSESRCLITLSLRIDQSGKPWIIEIHLGVGGDALADRLIPASFPGFDAFDALVGVCAGERAPLLDASPLPTGLVTGESGWVLIEGEDPEALRESARESVSRNWELPLALRCSEGHRSGGARQMPHHGQASESLDFTQVG